jgi:hypothetical protein
VITLYFIKAWSLDLLFIVTQYTYNEILSKILVNILLPVTDEVKNTNLAVLFVFLNQYFHLIKRRKVRGLGVGAAT